MMKTEEALAMIGGHVDEELLLRNEYLAAENEILRRKIQGRIELSNTERIRLAKIGQKNRNQSPQRCRHDRKARDDTSVVPHTCNVEI